MKARQFHWRIHDKPIDVRVERSEDSGAIYVDDRPTAFVVLERDTNRVVIDVEGRIHQAFMTSDRNGCTVWYEGRLFRLERIKTGVNEYASTATAGTGEIHSSMPGKVLRTLVNAGDNVQEGQPLLSLESMKMETTISATKTGRVAEVRVQAGQVVDLGELLLRIE
jgi:biotin carboxyl carrier protein